MRTALQCIVVFFAASSAFAQTWFVRQSGNDQADGKTPKTAFATVLRAVQAVNHGDSIVIGPGTYRCAALLAERFAADGSTMAITGDESGKLTGEKPGPVVLEPANPMEPALHLYRLHCFVASGLTFRGAGQGVKAERCLGITVERCTFDGLSRGLAAESTEDLSVDACVFRRCGIGLFVKGTRATRVTHATITGSSTAGALLLACGWGSITNSILAANNSNLIADEVSAAAWTSRHNVLTGTTGPWGAVPAIANPYEWDAASGQDRQSAHVPPSFVDPDGGDLRIDPAAAWGGGLPGMAVGAKIDPEPTQDRDGRPLRVRGKAVCVGAYDYPDPRPAAGWRKIATLKARGPAQVRQSAGVYRTDGTLVRTLLADAPRVADLYWDGLDDLGQPAPAGEYEVRSVSHDVRIVDDGAMGDNGAAMGAYHCDNADRVVALPDGGFVITTIYDEAGYPLRRYASSGQPIQATNFAEKDFTGGLALVGGVSGIVGGVSPRRDTRDGDVPPTKTREEDIPPTTPVEGFIGAVGKGEGTKLIRLTPSCERAKMANGADSYPVFAPGEKAPGGVAGVAVIGQTAFVGIPDLSLIRSIDLASGQKKRDWPLPGAGDVAADEKGALWALAGPVGGVSTRRDSRDGDVPPTKEVVSLRPDGSVGQRYATGLETPQYLAAGAGRLAVIDRKAAKVAWLDAASGKIIRTLGRERPKGEWTPVASDLFSDPRDAAITPDGRLLLCEHARLRCLWPESGAVAFEALSNFMDTAVVHPTQPEYVYCWPGIFRVDPKTGAWEWLVESPRGSVEVPGEKKPVSLSPGSPHGAVVLGGRPFIFYFSRHGKGDLLLLDVSDPLKPRTALDYDNRHKALGGWAYTTIAFTKGGDIIAGGHYSLEFKRIPFQGLDGQGNPTFDFDHPVTLGPKEDPSPRKMKCNAAITADRTTGDIYYLAVTDLYNKMVPGWGADGTGVGRSTPDGTPLWFALSSGGNYMSVSAVNDGKNAWIMAAKSFGGQVDLFNADGLRLATGNWSWPCNYSIGFVDLRYGVHAYLRPDGKPGAYVEDDAIGRFARLRVEGADTIERSVIRFTWNNPATQAGPPPLPDRTQGKPVERLLTIPRVPELKASGDWAPWENAGVMPQIVMLPTPGFRRSVPDDLWQTFRAGTAIGAIAHDGASLYAMFLVADDTMHFDDPKGNAMWQFDCVELWLEEEQFTLGMTSDGSPALFKHRHHNREGKEWAANYALPRDCIWAAKLDDLSSHPLGRHLGAVTGASFRGRPGYAVMARIPFAEVKLVGGIAGRGGKDILPTTGAPGEVVRVGVSLSCINAWGNEQDYKVNWPASLMFSDPTRSCPFAFGK
ncbi:MAG TPA: hypothetical protein P5118_03460 [Planctomycetota bacterium]|nr:hypothetical protein [Planctomycetota bacterium]